MSKEIQTAFRLIQDQQNVFNDFLLNLGIKPNQRELIRAFIQVSQGQGEFEVSLMDLANLLFKEPKTKTETLKKRAKDWLTVLLEWQDAHKLEIIRVTEKGHRKQNKNGKFNYSNSKYQLVLIEELGKLSLNSVNLKDHLEEAAKNATNSFQLSSKLKAFHPRHHRKKAVNTVYKLMENIFGYCLEAGDDPVKFCRNVISTANKKLNEMQREREERAKQEALISAFEARLKLPEFNNKEEVSMNCYR